MIQTFKTLFFVLASLSALLFASSCQDDLKPLEQEMDFSVSCSPTYAHIEREEQLVNTQILVSEQEVECPRPTKYSASFTYDETLGTLHFLGKRVKTGTSIPLSSLTNLSLTYQAKQLVGNTVKVTITNDAPKAVSKEATWTINADDTYSIETSQEGEGKLEVRGAKDLKRVAAGTELTVSATPADGWELVALTANKVDILSSKSFKVTENTTVRAVFTTENPKTYAVTLTKEGEGKVEITGADNLGAVVTGTKLTVTATPVDGWELTSMTANGVDIVSSKSFVVKSDTNVKVVFKKQPPKTYAVTLVKEGEGKVNITGANDLGAVVTGTKLTVTAEPADGWEVASMTANGVDIVSSKSFVVKSDTNVKVVFKKQPPKTYAVTLVKEGEGKVNITGANDLGAVVTGTKLTVYAIPADGWDLVGMTANGVDILVSTSFVVSENTAIRVTFTEKEEDPMAYICIYLQRSDLVSLYQRHSNYTLSDLELFQKFLPKVETENGELLSPKSIRKLSPGESSLYQRYWAISYPPVRVGTSVRFVLDEAAMSPLVATLTNGGMNYANRSWRADGNSEFNLRYTLANGFAYLAYPSQTNDEHGYITVKPPYRPFKVLARYGGKESGTAGYDPIPPHEIVAVPTQSQVEIIPIELNGWAYNGLRLTELDESQNPVNTDYTKDVLSIPINMKSSLITPHWYYKGEE